MKPYQFVTLADIRAQRPAGGMVPYGTLDHKPTWRELTRLEPRLADLLAEAKAVDGSDPHFCANRVWYSRGGLKRRLCALVGWDAERQDPVLRSPEAYDLAYHKIYDALPPCQDCWCL